MPKLMRKKIIKSNEVKPFPRHSIVCMTNQLNQLHFYMLIKFLCVLYATLTCLFYLELVKNYLFCSVLMQDAT